MRWVEREVEHIDGSRLVRCLIAVEGAAWESPGGALQFTRPTWRRFAGTWSYTRASNRIDATVVARAALQAYASGRLASGRDVTVEWLAACWNLGESKASKLYAAGGRSDYAQRVAALYHDKTF